jgi:hypothetical protein
VVVLFVYCVNAISRCVVYSDAFKSQVQVSSACMV